MPALRMPSRRCAGRATFSDLFPGENYSATWGAYQAVVGVAWSKKCSTMCVYPCFISLTASTFGTASRSNSSKGKEERRSVEIKHVFGVISAQDCTDLVCADIHLIVQDDPIGRMDAPAVPVHPVIDQVDLQTGVNPQPDEIPGIHLGGVGQRWRGQSFHSDAYIIAEQRILIGE